MSLRLVVEQTAPVRGNVDGNAAAIQGRIEASTDADLVLFPELCLTGYALGQRTPEVAVRVGAEGAPSGGEGGLALGLPAGGPVAVVGLVERGEDELVYNTAVALRGDEVLTRHRKVYLPTYGMFEEGRHFAPGRSGPETFALSGGWRAGILVCEDLWHPALAYLLALRGADVILVMSAAVGRGRPEAQETADVPLFSSMERWELLARSVAVHNGVYVALSNRVGVEDGLTFAGGSLVVDPAGEVVARAPQGREARLEVTLERDPIRRARHPFSHLRDEDPALVRDALDRILRERGR